MSDLTPEHVEKIVDRKLDSIDRWRVRMEADIKHHRETLYGNGKPGMDEMLREIVAYVNEQKAKEKEGWSDAKKFAIGVAAVIVNVVINIIVVRLIG